MNPRIGSGLKYIRRLLVEKAVEPVQNRKDGTKEGARNALSRRTPGNRGPGVDSSSFDTMEGRYLETPGEAVEGVILQRQRYESVGKDGVKGRRWLSQTIKGLWEILTAVAQNQE